MLVDGLATEITGAELSFTAEEAAELLGDERPAGVAQHGRHAAPPNRRLGGGDRLRRPRRRPVRDDGDDSPDRGDRQLFAYFAEEVLAAETPATRAALRVAATLPWLTPELAAHLGLGEAGARLADPERASIMMTPVADVPGAVAVTPLVRQLLGSDPAATGDVSVDDAAAAWYEARGAHSAP